MFLAFIFVFTIFFLCFLTWLASEVIDWGLHHFAKLPFTQGLLNADREKSDICATFIYFGQKSKIKQKIGPEHYVSLSVEPDQVWREIGAAHGATGNEFGWH